MLTREERTRGVQDAERGQDRSLWAILGWKTGHFSRKMRYRFPGQDIYYLGLCLRHSNKCQIREIYEFLLRQSSSFESSSGCQNNVPIGKSHSFGSPDILEYVEMKLPISSEGRFLFYQFAGQEPTLNTYWQNMKKKMKCWLVNQHKKLWQNFNSTQKQAHEMISCPSLAVKIRLLSSSRMECRVVTDLLT